MRAGQVRRRLILAVHLLILGHRSRGDMSGGATNTVTPVPLQRWHPRAPSMALPGRAAKRMEQVRPSVPHPPCVPRRRTVPQPIGLPPRHRTQQGASNSGIVDSEKRVATNKTRVSASRSLIECHSMGHRAERMARMGSLLGQNGNRIMKYRLQSK